MVKLIVAMLAGNCENTINMALESIKDSDRIYIIYDTTSKDKTHEKIEQFMINREKGLTIVIDRPYDHSYENKIANGQARNHYLDILKKNHLGDFCLVIDADEVVEDLPKLKKWIEKYESIFDLYPCCSVKMRHFIGDLGHEDTTVPEHLVQNRLFKITENLFYPNGEHPVLQCKDKEPRGYACRETTIWHLGYVPNLNYYKSRYENHVAKSEIHSRQFLDQWYLSHLLGKYPRGEVNPVDVPEIIWKHFNIDKDMWYFMNRGVEPKHFLMAKQWVDFFDDQYYFNIIEFGCGRSPYGLAFKTLDIDYTGIELSNFAVQTAFVPIKQGDITSYNSDKTYKLAMAFDVLEHVEPELLDKAIDTLIEHSNRYILISVPVIGDPNLLNDKTHKNFLTRDEWIKKFTDKRLKQIQTPAEFLFSSQIFIFEK